MRDVISYIVYEIVAGRFIFRGWSVLNTHMPEETPQGIIFGKTGILLHLVDGEPKLNVPKGQDAELLKFDHATIGDGKRVDGSFVRVQIYES